MKWKKYADKIGLYILSELNQPSKSGVSSKLILKVKCIEEFSR